MWEHPAARCPFRKFLASFLDLTFIGPRGVKSTLESLGSWAEPRTAMLVLATSLTERNPTHQRCPTVGPSIGMGMMLIVVAEKGKQSLHEFLHRTEVTSFQESPG